MSDFERIEESRERADGLAYEDWRDRIRLSDDEIEYLRDEQKRENDPDETEGDDDADDDA